MGVVDATVAPGLGCGGIGSNSRMSESSTRSTSGEGSPSRIVCANADSSACDSTCEMGEGNQGGGSVIPGQYAIEAVGDGSGDWRGGHDITERSKNGLSLVLPRDSMARRQRRRSMPNGERGPGHKKERLASILKEAVCAALSAEVAEAGEARIAHDSLRA